MRAGVRRNERRKLSTDSGVHNAPDWPLLITIGLLLGFGLLMLASAGAAVSFERFGDTYYSLKRQLLLGVVPGLVAFAFFLRRDYRELKPFAPLLFGGSLLLLVMVFMPGLGETYGGARRWLNVGFFSFQPSEVLKLGIVLYLASWLASHEREIGGWQTGFFPFVVIVGGTLCLIMLQPDLGTTALIGTTAVAMYFLAGAPWRQLFALLLGGLGAVAALIAVAPYRLNRLSAFLNPEADPQGIGYHVNQAILAVGSGGFFGQGLGQSRAKFQYLPEAVSDSIFAIIGEELGFLFSSILVFTFVFFLWRGIGLARRVPDDFGRYLAAGIVVWVATQAFVNIGAMIGLLPLTGLPLPFISYGGTSLAVTLAAVGILGSVSKAAVDTSR